jgi:hypothetical protein
LKRKLLTLDVQWLILLTYGDKDIHVDLLSDANLNLVTVIRTAWIYYFIITERLALRVELETIVDN